MPRAVFVYSMRCATVERTPLAPQDEEIGLCTRRVLETLQSVLVPESDALTAEHVLVGWQRAVRARLAEELWMDIDPVHVAGLSAEELESAAKAVLAHGHPVLPRPTQEEMQNGKDPLLAATGARSWKELARTGASYVIGWTDDKIRVEMSRLGKKGRWEYDPQKRQELPPDTPTEDVVAVIMKDIRPRPEVWE